MMTTVERVAEQIAPNSCPVLLVGAPGTGKHSLALRIYQLSTRVDRSFLEVNCDRAPADCFVKGSRYLSCGTLYLDEIAALTAEQQSRLLDVFFSPTANWETLPRLITATSCEDEALFRRGILSESLERCVGGISLRLPKLHERGADVISLAEHFVRSYAEDFGRPEPPLTPDVVAFFLKYSWPGNIDELEAATKALVALGNGRTAVAALQASVLAETGTQADLNNTSLKNAARLASQRAERALIAEVLRATGGNRKAAAQRLQISYKALLYKLKDIGVSDSLSGQGEEL